MTSFPENLDPELVERLVSSGGGALARKMGIEFLELSAEHSVATMPVEDNTQVWFHMYGCNLNLDDDGNITSVSDGAGTLRGYLAMCEAQGLGVPDVVIN